MGKYEYLYYNVNVFWTTIAYQELSAQHIMEDHVSYM